MKNKSFLISNIEKLLENEKISGGELINDMEKIEKIEKVVKPIVKIKNKILNEEKQYTPIFNNKTKSKKYINLNNITLILD